MALPGSLLCLCALWSADRQRSATGRPLCPQLGPGPHFRARTCWLRPASHTRDSKKWPSGLFAVHSFIDHLLSVCCVPGTAGCWRCLGKASRELPSGAHFAVRASGETTPEQDADFSHTEPFSFENVDALWPSGVSGRLLTYGSMLVCAHWIDKIPQPRGLKQQKCLFSQF